jgi:hypothetical protein
MDLLNLKTKRAPLTFVVCGLFPLNSAFIHMVHYIFSFFIGVIFLPFSDDCWSHHLHNLFGTIFSYESVEIWRSVITYPQNLLIFLIFNYIGICNLLDKLRDYGLKEI